MRRAALLTLAALAATPVVGCGDDSDGSTRVEGGTLTIYASLPAHGEEAGVGAAVETGMRRALADADARAAGRDVRFVALPSTRPGDRIWDPGTVEANAEQAADDPTAIAYLGELDQGGSAVSLPVTNRERLLQVSPADGLTSLTRTPPGRPRAGPERYYPEERRTFARLVAPDVESARGIVAAMRQRKARRLAVLEGDGIAERELEGMVLSLIGTGMPQTQARVAVRDDLEPEDVDDVVEEVAAVGPDAILYAGSAGPEATAVIAAVGARLPDVPLWGGPQLAPAPIPGASRDACAWTAVPLRSDLSPRGRRLLASMERQQGRALAPEALLGYTAMQLALETIEEGGPDRARVSRAAREPRRREGALGPYTIDRRGDPIEQPPSCVRLGA